MLRKAALEIAQEMSNPEFLDIAEIIDDEYPPGGENYDEETYEAEAIYVLSLIRNSTVTITLSAERKCPVSSAFTQKEALIYQDEGFW